MIQREMKIDSAGFYNDSQLFFHIDSISFIDRRGSILMIAVNLSALSITFPSDDKAAEMFDRITDEIMRRKQARDHMQAQLRTTGALVPSVLGDGRSYG